MRVDAASLLCVHGAGRGLGRGCCPALPNRPLPPSLPTCLPACLDRVVFLELIPGFALYRGMYEIGAYAFRGAYKVGSGGLGWAWGSELGVPPLLGSGCRGGTRGLCVHHPTVRATSADSFTTE